MKVLIFHHAILPYRIRFFNEIYDHFDTSIVLYFKNTDDNQFDYESIEKKFHFVPEWFSHEIKIRGRKWHIGHRKYINKFDPDLIIVSEFGESLWSAVTTKLFRKKKYKIVTICDDSLDIAQNRKGIRKYSRNLALKYIDGIILCNDEAEIWYRTHYKTKTYFFPIIQCESDFYADFDTARLIADRLFKIYKFENKRIFLFVGRLIPEKNIEYLINSFMRQHELHPENQLVIVGGESFKDVGFKERMEQKLLINHAADYIHFVGRKEGSELKAWYILSQIFILPSVWEPFGAVVNEALLAGDYVMVSKRAGSKCLVTKDNGEIIDIDKADINFEDICKKVPVLSMELENKVNKMTYTFSDKIQGLINWIGSI